MGCGDDETYNIPFKKKKKTNFLDDNDSEGEKMFKEKVEETKIIQKLRERPAGVDIVGLVLGESVVSDSLTVRHLHVHVIKMKFTIDQRSNARFMLIYMDPFNIETGAKYSCTEKMLKNTKYKPNDTYDTSIRTQFNIKTNKRNEAMVEYIEEELSKRKSKEYNNNAANNTNIDKRSYCLPEKAGLRALLDAS